ncbi:MAG: dienelactone hydrolase family protein [Proteobacteria bacterium]|nr:dienelactone hydrolase family protein [Pseudomonadota bacterium]
MFKRIAAVIVLSASSATGAAESFKGQAVPYSAGSVQMEGYRSGDGKKGSVLVVHDWMGLTDKTKMKADAIAALGYTVFAADVFGKSVRPKNPDEARANSSAYYKDRKLFRERLNAGLLQLRSISGSLPVAAVGYCFGGTAVIELARSGADVRAVVSFHGGLDSPSPADGKNIKARVLALHGADDPVVPAANLAAFEDEMRAHKVDWQLIKYGGAVHSFTDPFAGNNPAKGSAYNRTADQRSWQAMQNFLEESLAK